MLVVACVLMVSVDVTAPVPEITAGMLAEQVGASIAPGTPATTAQVSATVPVKPPLGVIVSVEVAELPWTTAVVGVAVIENAPDPEVVCMT